MLLRSVIVTGCLLGGSAAIERASVPEVLSLRAPLGDLALSFDGWSGAEGPRFDERTVQVLGADEYLNRVYYDASRTPVSLFVAFYGSQRQGDAMHSPLNCLPGSGWQPIAHERVRVAVESTGGATGVEVNQLLIEKGGERQAVLYWYQARDRVVASEYWSKAYTMADAVRLNRTDGAIVRIVVPISGSGDAAVDAARRFAAAAFPRVTALLPS